MKGQWEVKEISSKGAGKGYTAYIWDNWFCVAQVKANSILREDTQELAALIAAAPDLLNACEELYSFALEGNQNIAELRLKVCEIGRLAISRAKGEGK